MPTRAATTSSGRIFRRRAAIAVVAVLTTACGTGGGDAGDDGSAGGGTPCATPCAVSVVATHPTPHLHQIAATSSAVLAAGNDTLTASSVDPHNVLTLYPMPTGEPEPFAWGDTTPLPMRQLLVDGDDLVVTFGGTTTLGVFFVCSISARSCGERFATADDSVMASDDGLLVTASADQGRWLLTCWDRREQGRCPADDPQLEFGIFQTPEGESRSPRGLAMHGGAALVLEDSGGAARLIRVRSHDDVSEVDLQQTSTTASEVDLRTLVVDGDLAYAATGRGVVAIDLATDEVRLLAADDDGVASVAVTEDLVVWTSGAGRNDDAPRAVRGVSRGGGRAATIAANQLAPRSLVSNGRSLFWTVGDSSEVRSVTP